MLASRTDTSWKLIEDINNPFTDIAGSRLSSGPDPE